MDLAAIAAVLAALGGVVKLVLDANAKQAAAHTKAIEQMQDRQEKFLGNHMSANTKALNDLVVVIEQLVEEARDGNA